MPTYTGGAYSSSETNYKKYSFQDMEKANLSVDTKAGWIAVLQHYFVSAWCQTKMRITAFIHAPIMG